MNTGTSGTPWPGTIVVGVDGSEGATSAALWAAAEAGRRDQGLRLVHGADLDRLMRFATFETTEHVLEAGRVLLASTAEAVTERFPRLTVTRELSPKEPAAALHLTAGPEDTIVVGSRGGGGLSSLRLGSVGLGVAAGSSLPVIVVRGETERPETALVTAAVRGQSDADWLSVAAKEAQVREACLQLLSVRSLLARASAAASRDDAEETARQCGEGVRMLASGIQDKFSGLSVTARTEFGRSAARVLVESSRHADLMIVGGHRQPAVISPNLSHVAHAMLHHSHCPVEVVPRRARTNEEE